MCTHIYTHTQIYIYEHIHTYTHTYTNKFTCTYTYIFTYTYIHIHTHKYIHTHTHTHTYKTLIIPKINHVIANITTPEWFVKKVQEIILEFLWNNKPPKIKKQNSNEYCRQRWIKIS